MKGLDSSRFNQIKQALKQRAMSGKLEWGPNEFNFALSMGVNRETLHKIRKAKDYKEYLSKNRAQNVKPHKKFDK